MATIHNKANLDDIASTVIMSGDPVRIKNIASKYLIKSNNDGVSNKQRPMYYEDPLKNDIRALRSVNMYQFVYKNPIYQVMNIWGKQNTAQDTTGKSGGQSELSVQVTTTAGSPALFNPSMAVNAIGITENVPLLNSVRSGKQYHISEPTIENLIKGSKKDTGILGNARYRLIDFIFVLCDLFILKLKEKKIKFKQNLLFNYIIFFLKLEFLECFGLGLGVILRGVQKRELQ